MIGTESIAGMTLSCAGCGAEPPVSNPFRCPNATGGDDIDHVVTRRLPPSPPFRPIDDEENPYVHFRERFYFYQLARAHGLSDGDVVRLIEDLDERVCDVDGTGFRKTPFFASSSLSDAVGGEVTVFAKNETRNVAGSHKARHLVGTLLWLSVMERCGLSAAPAPKLAIASCGNAALAAATLARAADCPLDVFIPVWADGNIVARLEKLGARLVICERREGESGDPCYLRFQEAVAGGAIPFSCQGTDNGLAVESGQTLGYEMASELIRAGESLDRLVLQVGGGAFASACITSFRELVDEGLIDRMPRISVVQTTGASPLVRATELLVERTRSSQASNAVEEALSYARAHRSELMWPWEKEPKSVASGILDDETYDWFAIVRGILETGGEAVAVSEARLETAHEIANTVPETWVSHTGSSGLAGLLELLSIGVVAPGEKVGIVLTGVR